MIASNKGTICTRNQRSSIRKINPGTYLEDDVIHLKNNFLIKPKRGVIYRCFYFEAKKRCTLLINFILLIRFLFETLQLRNPTFGHLMGCILM